MSNNPAKLYLEGLSKSGSRSMGSLLKQAANRLNIGDTATTSNWPSLHYEDIVTLRNQMIREQLSPATINTTLTGIRSVLTTAYHMGNYSSEELTRVKTIKRVRGRNKPPGQALTSNNARKLLDSCDRTTSGIRDHAILSLLLYLGLRRDELIHLNLSSINGRELTIHGKGAKPRISHVPDDAYNSLHNWLKVRKDKPGPLFYPVNRFGALINRRMSGQAIYSLTKKHCQQASIREVTPHDLRRTFITALIRSGVDLNTVRSLAGHQDINTTARYDRREEEETLCATSLVSYQ